MFDHKDKQLTQAILKASGGVPLTEDQAKTIIKMRNHIEVVNKEKQIFKTTESGDLKHSSASSSPQKSQEKDGHIPSGFDES